MSERVLTVADEQGATTERAVLTRCHPDEPVFVLLGHDMFASRTVRYWRFLAEAAGVAPERLAQADTQARAMAAWPDGRAPGLRPTSLAFDAGARFQRENPESHLNRADPACPVFVLRARDELADRAVEFWAWAAATHGAPDPSRARAALKVAAAMRLWLGRRAPGLAPIGDSEEDGVGDAVDMPSGAMPTASHPFDQATVDRLLEPLGPQPELSQEEVDAWEAALMAADQARLAVDGTLTDVDLAGFAPFDCVTGSLARALIGARAFEPGPALNAYVVQTETADTGLLKGHGLQVLAFAEFGNDIGRMARAWCALRAEANL